MAESWLTRLRRRVSSWPRWSGRALLCTWWLLMFAATHIPMPSKVGDSPVPDKLIHFLMFLGLGFLLPLWRGWSSELPPRRLLALFGIMTLYAIADELLQIPVGRTAEWLDGAADLTGATSGLLLASLLLPKPHSARSA